jgi:hypothetical protein
MINKDLTHNCPQELELWIDNDEYLHKQWRRTLRTGSMMIIKDAFEESGFKYREDQWEHLVDLFEEHFKDEADRLNSYCSPLQ